MVLPAVSAWASYFWRISGRGGSESAGEGEGDHENCCQEEKKSYQQMLAMERKKQNSLASMAMSGAHGPSVADKQLASWLPRLDLEEI